MVHTSVLSTFRAVSSRLSVTNKTKINAMWATSPVFVNENMKE